MGAGNSTPRQKLYFRLSRVLPEGGCSSDSFWKDKENKPFGGDKDREQFIHSVITVITRNGQLDLNNHIFRLLFSRRQDERYVARIVAEQDGVITATIEPEADGEDQTEAFKALKKWVEIRLEHILHELQDGSAAVTSVAMSRRSSVALSERPSVATLRNVPVDSPPAYGDGDSKTKLRKSQR